MDDRDLQIPTPDSWSKFEDLCHRLFKEIWKDTYTQKNGRRGQKQHGVDVFGSPNQNHGTYHGVQCKGKNNNYGSKATLVELKEEIEKAEKFEPKLEHWVYITTAPTDQALQKEARLISKERQALGLFTVSVFGWDDVQTLLCENKAVLREFYPGYGIDFEKLIDHVKSIPKSFDVNHLVSLIRENNLSTLYQSGRWVSVEFNSGRGLGPALMGRSLGPSDAISCPQFYEVNTVINELEKTYFSRIIGEPGAGKSLCAFQVAKHFYEEGWCIYRLDDPKNVIPDAPTLKDNKVFLIIDDAHLSNPANLRILEDSANASLIILSTHHANEKDPALRNTVALDTERAVRTIAKSLLENYSETLAEVSKVDDRIGEKHMDTELTYRIEEAEKIAKFPWQFCFILGGGWRRAGIVADSLRAEGADIILAAIAIHQLASRDAAPERSRFKSYVAASNIDITIYDNVIQWLTEQRLLISIEDLRCPHLKFASVILFKILDGQTETGRALIGGLMEQILEDTNQPLEGKRYLLREVSFGGRYRQWSYLISERVIWPLLEECWNAINPADILHACYFLTEIEPYIKGWPQSVFNSNAIEIIAEWMNTAEYPSGYGLSSLINNIGNKDNELAKYILLASDPSKIAHAVSNVNPENAGHLGELISKVWFARDTDWSKKLESDLDRIAILESVEQWTIDDHAGLFATYCQSLSYINEELGLSIIEAYIPVAQQLFKINPVKAFRDLDDVVTHVLRILDVLNVYVGKHAPQKRHKQIGRQMISKLDARSLANHLSDSRLRQFQTVTFLLVFLLDTLPSKFNKVVSHLEWKKISTTIGDHWKNLPHEAEILFGVTYASQPNRKTIEKVIDDNLDAMELFPPRLALINSQAAIRHVESGKILRLSQHGHVEWRYAAGVIAIFADKRPDLLGELLKPVEKIASKCLSQAHESWYEEAAEFIKMLIIVRAESMTSIIDGIDIKTAEKGWIAALKKGGKPRKTVSFLVEFSISRSDAIGEVARKIRRRFPKSSTPKAMKLKVHIT